MTAATFNYQNNLAFSSELPMLQIAWDSTSLGYLKECPRKYYYEMILGRAPRGENVHFVFGGHYHKALEIYDHAKSAGADHADATDAALNYCLTETVVRDANGWRPWSSDDANKNRLTLVRSVLWYLEHFADDPLETVQLANGKPAVELSFRFEIDLEAPTGEQYLLCGHLDRLVQDQSGTLYVLDRKTSKNTISASSFRNYKPDNQMGLYDFAAPIVYSVPVAGVLIDLAQIGATFTRFLRAPIHRDSQMKDEWYRDTLYYLQLAARFAEQEYWPMNDKSCGNYGGCPFRDICAKSPATREKWLMGLTTTREWDPMKVRGSI